MVGSARRPTTKAWVSATPPAKSPITSRPMSTPNATALVAELQKAGMAQSVEWKEGFHERRDGRNGGGDPWHTDGRLRDRHAAPIWVK